MGTKRYRPSELVARRRKILNALAFMPGNDPHNAAMQQELAEDRTLTYRYSVVLEWQEGDKEYNV